MPAPAAPRFRCAARPDIEHLVTMQRQRSFYGGRGICVARRRSLLPAICLAGAGLLARAEIVINEIHHDPDVKTEWVEFVELLNTGDTEVDLSGWSFTDGIDFAFPQDTSIGAGAYLVVAQDPVALMQKFNADALGPWTGRLDSNGERIVLRDAAGNTVDEVDYQLGFPWPTVGDPPGYSIELIHPSLDNDLGGHWRPSVAGTVAPSEDMLVARGATWRYLKATQEASDPTTAWRERTFNDGAWETGALPIGYGENFMQTLLDDMSGNYSGVFLRKAFDVADPGAIASLTLFAQYDDGFKVWINGQHLLDVNIAGGEVPFDGTAGGAGESHDYHEFDLGNPTYLRTGQNVIAVQAHNASLGGSSDFFMDFELMSGTGPSGRGPTPGRRNSAFSAKAPPAVRQVDHMPREPRSGEAVVVTAKITDPDGVGAVQLLYQVVEPGAYIELTDPAYETDWTALPMNDAGQDGDELAGDSVFSATVPAAIQEHRRLVRYRITAADATGLEIRAPLLDDPTPNFAWFVYDGVPAWNGAVRPGAAGTLGQTFAVPEEEMNRLPVYHLLAKKSVVEEATWFSRYGGDLYRWGGTLVYDGEVYDHIRYRARGGVWRYAMAKNMWKFDFNRGHDFQARDDWGRKYDVKWTKLNLGASIQQGDYDHRGEQGMFEALGFRFFNLVGVPSMRTSFVQFRIIDEATETSPGDQYEGDFWGVYLSTEQPNGRFLDEHGLPDGNFYKMEGGGGELNNLGPYGPVNKSDLNTFLNQYNGATEDWWYDNLEVSDYLSYQAIVQGIHHYDICFNKNYFYYFNPLDSRVTVVPWDLDLTWAENMYASGCGGVDNIKSRLLDRPSSYPRIAIEYRNRVREVRDLLWNDDEAWRLIDEYAGRLQGPATGPTLLDADRAQWDYNPKMVDGRYTTSPGGKAGHGRFYQWPREPWVTKDFAGCVQLMKGYVAFRASNNSARAQPLDNIASDNAIPATPTLTYAGPDGFPVNRLTFQPGAYSGVNPFGAVKWRVGEVTRPDQPGWSSDKPWKYEIEAVWESTPPSAQGNLMSIPPGTLAVGHVYRARVQYLDQTGRASHWSDPVEFVAGAPDNTAALLDNLVVTELMYHAPDGSDFDFIELHNGSRDLQLRLGGVTFTDGIDFTFPSSALLTPGAYAIVVKASPVANYASFREHYGLDGDVLILGPYDGNFSDGGENVTLRTASAGDAIFSFAYNDSRGWPLAPDGAGHSLVPRFGPDDVIPEGALDYGGNWRASARIGGSPGAADPEPQPRLLLNEIAAHTDFLSELDSNDWIELINPDAVPLTLGENWFLSDSASDLRKWMIPPETTIPGGGLVSFDEITGFHFPTNQGFGLSKDGEQVLLSFLPGDGTDRVEDAIEFPAEANGWSYGRVSPDGHWWAPLTPRTRNTANDPLPDAPRITEVMYHPLETGTPPEEDPALEFIEITGAASPTEFWNTNGTWRVSGDVSFAFPEDFTLGARVVALLVNFDPTDAPVRNAFLAAYGLEGEVPVLLGPYGGRLPNRTGRLTLEQPQASDIPDEVLSWVTLDEVIFADASPWPADADGAGQSLARQNLDRAGNDPHAWLAAEPSPGAFSVSGEEDADADGIPDEWERRYGLNPADETDAELDLDGDGLTNRDEYEAGTHPGDPASMLAIASAGFTEPGGNGLRLTFPAIAGKDYTVLYADDLVAGGWVKLADVPPMRCDCTAEVVDEAPPVNGERFYRVVTPAVR